MAIAFHKKLTLILLAVWLPLCPGCLTVAMWRGHRWREVRTVERRMPDGSVRSREVAETHYWSGGLKVCATPFTLAIDIGTFLFILWLIDQLKDDDDEDEESNASQGGAREISHVRRRPG